MHTHVIQAKQFTILTEITSHTTHAHYTMHIVALYILNGTSFALVTVMSAINPTRLFVVVFNFAQ